MLHPPLYVNRFSAHTSIFEPVGTAIFSVKERLTIRQSASNTALAFGRVGAVEEGDVLVANITEPVKIEISKNSSTDG